MSCSRCQQRAALCPCPQVYVLKRPHVDEFLQRMGELFECVLFTASLAKVGAPDLPRHPSSGTAGTPVPPRPWPGKLRHSEPCGELGVIVAVGWAGWCGGSW